MLPMLNDTVSTSALVLGTPWVLSLPSEKSLVFQWKSLSSLILLPFLEYLLWTRQLCLALYEDYHLIPIITLVLFYLFC